MQVAPIDLIELVKVIFYGVATLCVPLATVYIMLAAARTKRVEAASVVTVATVTAVKEELSKVKDNVVLLEKNTNSLSTQLNAASRKNGLAEGEAIGERRGEDQARQLAQGQREGREIERASVAASQAQATTAISSPSPAPELAGKAGDDQIPVKDDRVATEIGKLTDAVEKSAAKPK